MGSRYAGCGWSNETFGEYLDAWELKGGLQAVLDSACPSLISAYCHVNLTDPATGNMAEPVAFNIASRHGRSSGLDGSGCPRQWRRRCS